MTNKEKFIHAVSGMYRNFTDEEKFNLLMQDINSYEVPKNVDNQTIYNFIKCVEASREALKKGEIAKFHLQREAFIEYAMLIIEKVTE